jgi:predicted RNase H-like nuclease (RuvC/YqgF family)
MYEVTIKYLPQAEAAFNDFIEQYAKYILEIKPASELLAKIANLEEANEQLKDNLSDLKSDNESLESDKDEAEENLRQMELVNKNLREANERLIKEPQNEVIALLNEKLANEMRTVHALQEELELAEIDLSQAYARIEELEATK